MCWHFKGHPAYLNWILNLAWKLHSTPPSWQGGGPRKNLEEEVLEKKQKQGQLIFALYCLLPLVLLNLYYSLVKSGLKRHIDSSASGCRIGSTISTRDYWIASMDNLKFASVAHNILSDAKINLNWHTWALCPIVQSSLLDNCLFRKI